MTPYEKKPRDVWSTGASEVTYQTRASTETKPQLLSSRDKTYSVEELSPLRGAHALTRDEMLKSFYVNEAVRNGEQRAASGGWPTSAQMTALNRRFKK